MYFLVFHLYKQRKDKKIIIIILLYCKYCCNYLWAMGPWIIPSNISLILDGESPERGLLKIILRGIKKKSWKADLKTRRAIRLVNTIVYSIVLQLLQLTQCGEKSCRRVVLFLVSVHFSKFRPTLWSCVFLIPRCFIEIFGGSRKKL